MVSFFVHLSICKAVEAVHFSYTVAAKIPSVITVRESKNPTFTFLLAKCQTIILIRVLRIVDFGVKLCK